MAHTAMSGSGTTAGDDPLQTAVWRLRSRACWTDAASLLERLAATDARAALQRAALLGERCLYTEQGWAAAEDALRAAEALAHNDGERGAAACERGQLAYSATLLGSETGPTRHAPRSAGPPRCSRPAPRDAPCSTSGAA